MTALDTAATIGVVGAGAMGSGIAQVAAVAGHAVLLYDAFEGAAEKGRAAIAGFLDRAVDKGRMTAAERDAAVGRISVVGGLDDFAAAALVIEAVVEDLDVKRQVFAALEKVCADDAILATNTSSISITAIAAPLARPRNLVGMHFFNPAPLMALVEIVSGLLSDATVAATVYDTAAAWGKSPVHAKSTPGFIVNRVARPFYGEALRILGEGFADVATIDTVIREAGGFRMGPFQLMDLVGNDVNYAVTNSVFDAFYQDPRYGPSLIQKELVEAGRLGRKSGRGHYDHAEGAQAPEPATAAPAPPPSSVRLQGDLGVAQPLAALIEGAGIAVGRQAGPPALIADGVEMRLSDGRMATVAAAEDGIDDLVFFDLALDYETAPRLAIAVADQARPGAGETACGLLQAAGKSVSPIDDSPGLIVMRLVAMLANEGADVVQKGVSTAAGVDTAMRKGLNYPIGPLTWADRIGTARVLAVLDNLARTYGEDRYRPALLMRRRGTSNRDFHE